jgi:polar amino acid transport system substrate-binding protein
MALAPDLIRAFAPTGTLRASINTGNPILAKPGAAPGTAAGVSVDLAQGLADRLAVPLELVVFDTAGKSVDAVTAEQADIGFFAIDPKRGEGIHFTGPYVLIAGCYAVRNESPLQTNEQVDRAGTTVVVGKGSAYDLYLSRELKNATIERAASSPAVVSHFLAHGGDVAAGVKQQLEAEVQKAGGMRMLPGHFMVIQQAMGCPRSRGDTAARFLADYVEEMKAGGFVAAALQRHGVTGAAVAPPVASGNAM